TTASVPAPARIDHGAVELREVRRLREPERYERADERERPESLADGRRVRAEVAGRAELDRVVAERRRRLEQLTGRDEAAAVGGALPDAPRHGRSRHPEAHLIAPSVKPRTRWRCTSSANPTIGIAASVPAALIAPQSMSMRVISVDAPTGTVSDPGVEVRTS